MRIILLTNILSPYRKFFYDLLYSELNAEQIEFIVLVMSETESDRVWHYSTYQTSYTRLLKSVSADIFKMHIHYNPNIKKVLSELHPDIVVCGGSYMLPSIWGAISLKKKLQYRLLFWSESHLEENRSFNRFTFFIREHIRNSIYKKFDGFWFSGEKSKELIEKYCAGNSRLYFVPNLVDSVFFQQAITCTEERKAKIRTVLNVNPDNFTFVCPARLTNVKGILPFLKILKSSRNLDHVTLLIAGDGELCEQIEKESQLFHMDVRLLGQQTPEQVLDLYSVANAFLLPSLSDPNPLTCIEAAWAGLPFFVSEHVGNHPELIVQGENGYVFSYQNEKEAVHLLDELVEQPLSWSVKAKETTLCLVDRVYNPQAVIKRLSGEMQQLDWHDMSM